MNQTAMPSGFSLRLPKAATRLAESQRLRLATLQRLRWLSVAGQLAACVFVAWGLWYPYPVGWCLALIAASAVLNIALGLRSPKSHRLSARASAAILVFDVVQPSALLFLTGGIHNPFSIFLIVPVIIASATQPAATTVGLGLLALLAATLLAFVHLPLPWPDGAPLALPGPYVGGMWFAVVSMLVFTAFYVARVAAESRALAEALGATELALQREQHINALDGLAAAAAHELGSPLATIAVVATEMGRTVPAGDAQREDVDLLIGQVERCRDILKRLASLSSSSEEHMARLPVLSLVEEIAEPHRNFGIAIRVEAERGLDHPEPVMRRNAGVLYGLGNIVENAVDFAKSEVLICCAWNAWGVTLTILDDGPGFSPDVLARIGDPYMSDREPRERNGGGGLGLGLFIAKTLLERSGAAIRFENGEKKGAKVEIAWPHAVFSAVPVQEKTPA